ncbi:MAG: hypothetical protein EOP84_06425 [Verrucomicrobiaceae bacterium]|nr:MAG: hypothetical protein EOP84_06425 [Verrucomicrobiaceae bacterium]
MTDAQDDPLPPTTLPASTQLSLMNFADNADFIKRFSDEMSFALIDCGRFLDLERLAGITVGYDFDAALAAVDLGFESTRALEYTNNGDVVCVAKALNVLRDGRVMSHVVYNANFIEAMLDPTDANHMQALHIVAHELGHVAELKWRDEAMPDFILRHRYDNWVSGMLVEAAMVIWEEYAACRQTALIGNKEELKQTYAETFDKSASNSLSRTYEKIKAYRTHAQLDQLLVEAGEPLAMPLKLAGYLLGHLDGIEDESDLLILCPSYSKTHLAVIIPQIHQALRSLWETRTTWQGVEVFDDLVQLVIQTYEAGGIELIDQGSQFYVDVPFSAQTMPNGEADMLMIRLEKMFKR